MSGINEIISKISLKKYQERLECHASLVRVKSTPLLQNAMEKDKFFNQKVENLFTKEFLKCYNQITMIVR